MAKKGETKDPGGLKSAQKSPEDEFGQSLVFELNKFVKYMHLMADEPDVPRLTTMILKTGVVFIGGEDCAERASEYFRRRSVDRVSHSMKNVLQAGLLSAFGKAGLVKPSVLILREFERLGSGLESCFGELMTGMSNAAQLVIVLAFTSDKTYVVPDTLKPFLLPIDLKEA